MLGLWKFWEHLKYGECHVIVAVHSAPITCISVGSLFSPESVIKLPVEMVGYNIKL